MNFKTDPLIEVTPLRVPCISARRLVKYPVAPILNLSQNFFVDACQLLLVKV